MYEWTIVFNVLIENLYKCCNGNQQRQKKRNETVKKLYITQQVRQDCETKKKM